MGTPMPMGQFIRKLFYSQLFVHIPPPTGDFSGQTVIVTGANSGLGFEAAQHLLRLNATKIILAVRDLKKGETAAEQLLVLTGAKEARVEVWSLDLSDSASVQHFAQRASELERLDAVISNAGILTQKWSIVEGMEASLAVNVVNTTLLGLLLLPKLRASAKKYDSRGRMAFVSSDAHYIAQVNEAKVPGPLLDALNDKQVSNMEDRYSTSKLLLLYAIRKISEQSPVTHDSNVVINALTPGMCYSGLWRDEKPWLHSMIQGLLMRLLARTSSAGGGLLVEAIRPYTSTTNHGVFLMDRQIAENGPNIETESGKSLQQRFNDELFELLEKLSPGVTDELNPTL